MKEIKTGEEFRMFEPTGEPVIRVDMAAKKDRTLFLAVSSPYKEAGVWTINCSDW